MMNVGASGDEVPERVYLECMKGIILEVDIKRSAKTSELKFAISEKYQFPVEDQYLYCPGFGPMIDDLTLRSYYVKKNGNFQLDACPTEVDEEPSNATAFLEADERLSNLLERIKDENPTLVGMPRKIHVELLQQADREEVVTRLREHYHYKY